MLCLHSTGYCNKIVIANAIPKKYCLGGRHGEQAHKLSRNF